MTSTRLRTTKRAGAVALVLAAGSAGIVTTAGAASAIDLSAVRACESGGNYSTNTGNGFYGAYQFTQSTWESVGGSGSPATASPAEQDARASALAAQSGSSPWPVCGGSTDNSGATSSVAPAASRSVTRAPVQSATTSAQSYSSNTKTYRSAAPQVSTVYLSTKLAKQRRGDVTRLQQHLVSVSKFDIPVDGYYGPKTEAAVKALQKRNHKQVDGIAGPETLALYAR